MPGIEAQIAEAVRVVVREELARALREQRGPDLLTTDEAAQEARVRPKTIRAWVRAGRLQRVGRGRRIMVRRADLEAAREGPPRPAAALLSTLSGGR